MQHGGEYLVGDGHTGSADQGKSWVSGLLVRMKASRADGRACGEGDTQASHGQGQPRTESGRCCQKRGSRGGKKPRGLVLEEQSERV